MGRFFTPLVFLGTGLYVTWYNATHTGRVLALPFIERVVPSTADDLALRGEVSAGVMFALAVLFGLLALRRRRADGGDGA